MNHPNTTPAPEYRPVSPIQRHMIAESLRAPAGSGVYVEQVIFDILREIDFNQFKQAWLVVIQRYDALRTQFKRRKPDRLEQVIPPLYELNIETNDWSKFPSHEADELLNTFVQADRRLGFSPFSLPLFRIAFLKLSSGRSACIFSFFSAIVDSESIGMVMDDLLSAFQGRPPQSLSSGSNRPPRSWLRGQKPLTGAWDFLETLFKFTEGRLELPVTAAKSGIARERRTSQDVPLTTQRLTRRIPSELNARLARFCKENAIQLEHLFMAAFAILLSHYSGKKNIFFCIHYSARQASVSFQWGSGNYTNLLPGIFTVDPDQALLDFLQDVQRKWLEIRKLEQISLSDIRSRIRGKNDTDLFDIAFSYQAKSVNSAIDTEINKGFCKGLGILNRTPFSLFLSVSGTDQFSASIHYDRRRFDMAVIQDMMDHYLTLLNSIFKTVRPRLTDMSILSEREKEMIALQLNRMPMPPRPDSCLHHLFEIQASANHVLEAVSDKTGWITYGQLNKEANQTARFLNNLGVTPGSGVLILMEPEMICIKIILGILKSGAVVIPCSSRHSDDWVREVRRCLKPALVIGSAERSDRFYPDITGIISFEATAENIAGFADRPPVHSAVPEDVALLFCARRLQNMPVGIPVPHYALVSFIKSAIDAYEVLPGDTILHAGDVGTNDALALTFWSLLAGARLSVAPWEVPPSVAAVMDVCRKNSVTILQLPENTWRQMGSELNPADLPENLRLIIISRDPIRSGAPEKLPSGPARHIRLIATYGFMETTTAAIWTDLSEEADHNSQPIIIGRPFSSVSICLLNHFNQPALPGTPGVLHIGGPQLAKGYFQKPAHAPDDEHFRNLLFLGEENRYFRTGDLAKLSPEQELVFCGRLDPAIPNQGYHASRDTSDKMAGRYPQADVTGQASAHRTAFSPVIVLVGNSVRAAQSYKKTDMQGRPFFHAPIFIHFYGTDRPQFPLSLDIPDIAQKCIGDLLQTHPKGPYIIIGECQNSIVAHEMAIQLSEQNQRVDLMVIIDENWDIGTTSPQTKPDTNAGGLLGRGVGHYREFGGKHLIRTFFAKLRKRLFFYYKKCDNVRRMVHTALGIPVPIDIQFRTMEAVFYRACADSTYTPPLYDGPVLLLYSRNWIQTYAPNLHTCYKGPVRRIEYDSGHSEWFKPDMVGKIIQEIWKTLAQTSTFHR